MTKRWPHASEGRDVGGGVGAGEVVGSAVEPPRGALVGGRLGSARGAALTAARGRAVGASVAVTDGAEVI